MPKGSSSTVRCYFAPAGHRLVPAVASGCSCRSGGFVKYAAGFTVIVVLAVTAAGLALASKQRATQELRRGQEVPICHATHLKDHPYVSLLPDVDGVLTGHDAHDDDIIPPFEYEPKPGSGESGSYPGKNWTPENQQIWAF